MMNVAEEIDLRVLRRAVNAVLDHLIEDLSLDKVKIESGADYYWDLEPEQLYDVSNQPTEWDKGRLSDDADFVELIERGQSGDISYNLIHVAPLLRYLGEKIKR